ncbi:putative phage abortive infection protein [Chryseobacterium sp. Chry.R1]|uniref:putative phage abortive infection protein n=1 Tax=Chryseobacterium sp. Chry.R1 TaxID=3139392 RepID=UPI0031F90AAA
MKPTKPDYLVVFIILAILFIAAVILSTLYIGQDVNENTRGTFGDMFGAANALFTGLSFVGLIVTILLQRRDINNQRDLSNVQNFENTFFQMLSLYSNFVTTVERDDLKGRKYLNRLSWDFMHSLRELCYSKGTIDLTEVRNLYIEIHQVHRSEMDHHLRILYSIIELIDTSERIDKMKYFRIFKANLSLDEIALLYYGCLYNNDLIVKNMIEKFPIFEDLLLIHIPHLNIRNYYNKRVYN